MPKNLEEPIVFHVFGRSEDSAKSAVRFGAGLQKCVTVVDLRAWDAKDLENANCFSWFLEVWGFSSKCVKARSRAHRSRVS